MQLLMMDLVTREGCISDWADNYDSLATDDDGTCYKEGCTSDWADNYDPLATIDDGLVIKKVVHQIGQIIMMNMQLLMMVCVN